MSHTNKAKNLTIAYIGGGSRGWAWNLMADLALDGELAGVVRLYDLDPAAARANETIGNALGRRSDVKGSWKYLAVPNLQDALTGADFVICSILPGTFGEMQSDVHEPEKYGIYQSVGDTVGPGGLFRALRTIPMYVEIAQAIEKHCPQAWVINYTNPMSLCTRTLYATFPGIRAFGCCHEVFGTQALLAEMLGDLGVQAGVERHEIQVNVQGINHFTWLDSATWQGVDLVPLYQKFADKHSAEGFESKHDGNWLNSYFASAHRVKFDLFRRYGLIAAAGDRHLAEFMGPWYLKSPEVARSWKFTLTPVSWRVAHKKELEEKRRKLVAGTEAMKLASSGEEGIRQIKALVGLGDLVTNVNLPNRGQAPDLPHDVVVETNALFGAGGIRPITADRMTPAVRTLVARHVGNQETILEAALTRDSRVAFQAFVNDPLVTTDPADSRQLFDAMVANTRAYLPDWEK
jgi:alpha-galactosidase